MPTPRDLLNEAKTAIREVDPPDAGALLPGGGATVLDVREPDEYEQGAIPNAVHLRADAWRFRVEGKLPDKGGSGGGLLRRPACAPPRGRTIKSSATPTSSPWSAVSAAGRTPGVRGRRPRP